eukprot:TRINITY_DN1832_c0_g1_i2.p1 TRINITY_DN1832_c0_g1~~TRINITY_DN1832_c0_g1_i2.p1  ORF type:complete len:534 (+),score=213.40 TRINITY_DN1832_c0_g1_i2:143-1603(+)
MASPSSSSSTSYPSPDLVQYLESARMELSRLPVRPTAEQFSYAQAQLAAIERNLVRALETILLEASNSGMSDSDFRRLQKKKESVAEAEAAAARKRYEEVVELEKKHQHLEEVIRATELALVGVEEQQHQQSREDRDRQLLADVHRTLQGQEQQLSLEGRNLEWLPEMIGHASSLTSLDLSSNLLQSLPDSIAGLTQLQQLKLHGNLLQQLPDGIGLLFNLRCLDLSLNRLHVLPDSLVNCSALEELNLSMNKLEALPEKIWPGLKNLVQLRVGGNKLQKLPKSIGELSCLRLLDVHLNRLKELPSSLGQLVKLQQLNVSDNFADLKELPGSIGFLGSLQTLQLANNQISCLPLEVGRLTSLKQLSLEGNPLVVPPLYVVEKSSGDAKVVVGYMAKELEKATATGSTWSWISGLTGNWVLARWLKRILTGAVMQQVVLGMTGRGGSGLRLDNGHKAAEGQLLVEAQGGWKHSSSNSDTGAREVDAV